MKSNLSKQFSRLFVVTIFIFGVISLAGCVKKLPPPSEGSRFFSKMVNLKRDGKSLFLVYEMPPGEYRIYSITEGPINVTNAQSITSKLKQKPFILEEKMIIIYPRKVAYKQELIGASKWFRKKRKLKKMKNEEIVKIWEQLKEYKNFELWSFAETL